MKNYTLLFLLVFSSSFAQVGLGTLNPKTTLDVNGDINIRKDLKVGGTTTNDGNSGLEGQVLVSKGKDSAPSWKNISIPFAKDGDYQLVNTNVVYDRIGIDFGENTDNNASGYISTLNTSIDAQNPKWIEIKGLRIILPIEQTGNVVALNFQTGVESNSGINTITDNRVVRYMCGIFQNDKLVAFRGDELLDVHRKQGNNQGIYTINYLVDNLPIGNYTFKVACRRIQTTNGKYKFAVGRNIENSNVSNSFMLQSILKIELLEPVTYN